MGSTSWVAPVVRGVNNAMVGLTEVPWLGRLVGRGIVVISYVGRRSGKQVSLPVGYLRSGDEITINVALPDRKSWWRNFLGAGGPISLHLNGVDRSGHAIAERSDRGGVKVKVRLDDSQP